MGDTDEQPEKRHIGEVWEGPKNGSLRPRWGWGVPASQHIDVFTDLEAPQTTHSGDSHGSFITLA